MGETRAGSGDAPGAGSGGGAARPGETPAGADERPVNGLNVALFLVAMACFLAAVVGLLSAPQAGWPRVAFGIGLALNVVGVVVRWRARKNEAGGRPPTRG